MVAYGHLGSTLHLWINDAKELGIVISLGSWADVYGPFPDFWSAMHGVFSMEVVDTLMSSFIGERVPPFPEGFIHQPGSP